MKDQTRHTRRSTDVLDQMTREATREILIHHPGCWHTHHECALAEIERLQKIVLTLTQEVDDLRKDKELIYRYLKD